MPKTKVKKNKIVKKNKKKTIKEGKIIQKQNVTVNIDTKSNKSNKSKTKSKLTDRKLQSVNKSQIPISHHDTLHIERKDPNDESRLKKIEQNLSDGMKYITQQKSTPLLIENTPIRTPTTTTTTATIRRLPDYNSKTTAMKKLGIGSRTFNSLVSNKKIKTKTTPSGNTKYNVDDLIYQNRHNPIILNEQMEKMTKIIEKPVVKDEPYQADSENDNILNVTKYTTRSKSKSTKKKTDEIIQKYESPKSTKSTKIEKVQKRRGRPPKNTTTNTTTNNQQENDDPFISSDDEHNVLIGFNQPEQPIIDPNDYSINLSNLNDSSMNTGLSNTSGGNLTNNQQDDDLFMSTNY